MVGDNNVVKVADFGLARVIKEFQEGVYDAKEGTKFPIKWSPPEVSNELVANIIFQLANTSPNPVGIGEANIVSISIKSI